MRFIFVLLSLYFLFALPLKAQNEVKQLLKDLEKYDEDKNLDKAYQTSLELYQFYKKDKNSKKALEYLERANQYKKEIEKAPKSIWIINFLIGSVVIVIIVILLFTTRRYAKIGRLLKLQTQKIAHQNQQLQKKNAEIGEANKLILQKKETIEKSSRDILDSLLYAKRIQNAMLTSLSKIRKILPETFIYFNPRDTVSGDFYWFNNKSHRSIIAAIDCTGHGVPGALLSMIANELLNKIVILKGYTEPDKILRQLHLEVHETLKNTESEIPDGMDMALCVIHQVPEGMEELFGKPRIEFAGAKNSLIYIKNNYLEQIKGTMYPIGGFQFDEDLEFEKHIIELDQPTSIYLFSDGYLDQFGGDKRKKFMIKRFKELLLNIHCENAEKQKTILVETMETWMKGYGQLDDMLVIGVQLNT